MKSQSLFRYFGELLPEFGAIAVGMGSHFIAFIATIVMVQFQLRQLMVYTGV